MNKLTTSILAVVLTSSMMMVSAQETQGDSLRTQDIREVVVTGALGLKKRQDAVVSSNKVIGANELNQAANPNAAQALTGKVAGLQINTTNNAVDSSTRVVIRGNRSITGNNQALVVIDGVVSTLSLFQQLPPELVDNVNVIKGQQGAALYGERGSNGVIVVTTKRGSKSEKIQFNLTSSIDISSVYKLPKLQSKYGAGYPGDTFDPTDYNGTSYTQYENTNWGPAYSSALGGQLVPVGLPQADGSILQQRYSPLKDNVKYFFDKGVVYQNGLSMNVGGNDSYATLSINRLENDFLIKGDELTRNTLFFKAGKKIDKFRIDGTFNFIDQNTNKTSANLYAQALQAPSNVDIRQFAKSGIDGHWTSYAFNPYWLRDHYRTNNNTTTFNGVVSMGYDFTKNISLTYNGNIATTSSVNVDYNDQFKEEDAREYTGTGTDFDGETYFSMGGSSAIISAYNKRQTKSWKYYGDLMLNFNYDLSDNINFKANIGNNIQDTKEDYTEVGGDNLQIPGWYNILNVLNPSLFSDLNNGSYRKRSTAWFTNIDLAYKDFLYLNGTFRYEKSSALSVRSINTNEFKNEGYPYYSIGASFVPTKAFAGLKGDVLNYMKLSTSFTRTGNSGIDAFQIDQVGIFPTGYPFGDLSSYILNTTPVAEDITPEFNNTIEGNLSLGFFKDRITLEGSVYQTKTQDLITNATVPSSTGYRSVLDNVGSMKNKGFEVELGLTPFKSRDFEWNLKGSYSQYKSIVTELSAGATEVTLANAGYGIPASIVAVLGENMPVIKGIKYQRDPNGNIIVDEDGLPVSNSNYEILGKVNPDYILGFSTSIRFRNFTLSAVADYRTGNSFISQTKSLLGGQGALEKTADFDRSQGYIIPGSVQNTGTAANPIYTPNTTPVLGDPGYSGVTEYFTGNYQSAIGEEFVVDGTALKIREIAASYRVPKDVLSGTFVNSLVVGVYARNPFAWYAKENRNFADPENSNTTGNAGGIVATSQFPTYRSFGFNINVTF
jgi:TonB-linked SusC/RagA family outer membrane protein